MKWWIKLACLYQLSAPPSVVTGFSIVNKSPFLNAHASLQSANVQKNQINPKWVNKIPPSRHHRTSTSALAAYDQGTDTDPEPLVKEGNWAAYVDEENTGLVYYFNLRTGESVWEPPYDTFPEVDAPPPKSQDNDSIFGALENWILSWETANVVTADDIKRKEEKEAEKAEKAKAKKEQEASKPPNLFEMFGKKEEPKVESKEIKVDEPKVEVKMEESKVEVEKPVSPLSSANMFSFGNMNKPTEKKEIVMEEEIPLEPEPEPEPEFVEPTPELVSKSSTTTKPMSISFKNPFINQDNEPINVAPYQLAIDASYKILPHPAKVSWGGEDACFFQGRTFGVFDGVSGADKTDGIPLYSVTLAEQMQILVRETNDAIAVNGNQDGWPTEGLTMKQMTSLLKGAKDFANKYATGASTAIVASLGEDNYLRVLNVGDCTTAVIRDSKIVSRSKEISHFFDCPYQFSVDSPDKPSDGTKMNVEIIPGDVIIMATDGVYDNLNENQVIEAINRGKNPSATRMAANIAEDARRQSLDMEADTPYAREAQKNRDAMYANGKGGKLDDICCIVVKVS